MVARAEDRRLTALELLGQAGSSTQAEQQTTQTSKAGGPQGPEDRGAAPPEPSAAQNEAQSPAGACGVITGRGQFKPRF